MRVIGLTGGSGAGKTTVLEILQTHGAAALDCDRLYDGLLKEDEALRRELAETFVGAFLPDGSLDREKLGDLVFSDPDQMRRLNGIVFYHVGLAVRRRLTDLRRQGCRLAVIDAVNLAESGLGELCDTTVAVLAPEEDRLKRIMARDGIDRDHALRRIMAQQSDEEFARRCRIVLRNEGTMEDLRRQTEAALKEYWNETRGIGTMANNELREKLLYQKKNGFDRLPEQEIKAVETYCEGYKRFLNTAKTERECVTEAVKLAEQAGFRAWEMDRAYQPGEKFYYINRDKNVFLVVMGRESLAEGVNITTGHLDSPRIDLKPTPLYEEAEFAFFKTQHYGGIRPYHWLNIPLALHGVVYRRDGSKVDVTIGEAPDDPQFVICDLLPMLAKKQKAMTVEAAFPSEMLNIMLGSRPLAGDDGKERVKLEIMRLIHERYGIEEEDFVSAEIEVVPVIPARDVGFDRSLIGGYGQDDRVCSYAILKATLELETPRRTAVCILADTEEIASGGVTGTKSEVMEWFFTHLCKTQGVDVYDCFAKSFCMSADVTSGYDPNFSSVFDKHSVARFNYGVAVCKNTAKGGKSNTSDASAELMAYIRKTMNEGGVLWQTAQMGTNDSGAGGTLAKFVACRNIDTIDMGVPVISMHSPFEITSKIDCYMTYKAAKVLCEA